MQKVFRPPPDIHVLPSPFPLPHALSPFFLDIYWVTFPFTFRLLSRSSYSVAVTRVMFRTISFLFLFSFSFGGEIHQQSSLMLSEVLTRRPTVAGTALASPLYVRQDSSLPLAVNIFGGGQTVGIMVAPVCVPTCTVWMEADIVCFSLLSFVRISTLTPLVI